MSGSANRHANPLRVNPRKRPKVNYVYRPSSIDIQERKRAYKERQKAKRKAFESNNKEAVQAEKALSRSYTKNARLKSKYGITLADYNKMLWSQGGKCAICCVAEPTSSDPLHVDHCHATNKVRGLLCRSCNISLGNFRDDPAILEAAAAYLRKAMETLK